MTKEVRIQMRREVFNLNDGLRKHLKSI